MNKLTFGDSKATVARACGFNVSDPRVMIYANESCRRLVDMGRWVGTMLRYQVKLADGFVTWPRQIDTIELFNFDRYPGEVMNGWYEMVGNGPGIMSSENCYLGPVLIDRGTAATFDDIARGPDILRKVNVLARVAEADGAKIVVRGYDNNNQWIRSRVGDDWIDGEEILISTTNQFSVNNFAAVTDVIKPVTNGFVDMWEWNPTTSARCKLLGTYEPDETSPVYRRSIIPGLDATCCHQKCVTVYCKLRYIPVVRDNDYFLIGNLAAIKHGVMAIKKEEQELPDKAEIWWQKAISALEQELRSYYGIGPITRIRFANRNVFGGGGVRNML